MRRVLAALATESHSEREALRGLRRIEEVSDWSVTCVRGITSAAIDSLCNPTPPPYDGVILGTYVEPAGVLASVSADRLPPVVAFNRDTLAHGWPCVLPDDEQIGAVAADHLLDRGVGRFIVVNVSTHAFSTERRRGFAERIVAATGQEPIVLPFHDVIRGGLAAMAAWFQAVPIPPAGPLGVFALCDSWGEVVLNACAYGGLAVPEQVAVVSADNDPRSEVTRPPLSSITLRWADAGARAARMLKERMDGDAASARIERIAPGEVVTRASSDVVAVSDPVVANALRYMHGHYQEGIHVQEVADHIGAQRRTLERAFRAALRRTPKQELTRLRLDHAKRMLIEGEASLAEIAADVGYAAPTRLGISFKASFGVTPMDFRRKHRED